MHHNKLNESSQSKDAIETFFLTQYPTSTSSLCKRRKRSETRGLSILYTIESIDIFLTYLIIYENFLNTNNNDNKMSERRMEKEEEKLSFE